MSETLEMETDLIQKAVKERNEIIKEADEKAAKILASAETEVMRIKTDNDSQVLQLVGSDLRTVRNRIIGQAELKGKSDLMAARSKLLEQVYDNVRDKLKDIADGKDPNQQYSEILEKLLKEAVELVGGDDFIIAVNKRDQSYMKSEIGVLTFKLGVKLRLSTELIDVIGGLVCTSGTGDKIYYNTLDGRLEHVRRIKAAEIATKLGVI